MDEKVLKCYWSIMWTCIYEFKIT